MKPQAVINALKCLEGHRVKTNDSYGLHVIQVIKLLKHNWANCQNDILLFTGRFGIQGGEYMPNGIELSSWKIVGIETDGQGGVYVCFRDRDKLYFRSIRIDD